MGLGYVLIQAIRFGSSMVLTRLLAPDMYGLMAIGSVVVAGVTLISDIGLAQNVIQSPRAGERLFLNTIWVMQVARGVVIALVMLLCAGGLWLVIAHWPSSVPGAYGDPAAPLVIAVLALVPLVMGFESTRVATVRRALVLAPLVRLEVLSQVVATTLTIALAYFWPAVWVLPASWVLLSLAQVVISHTLLPGEANRFEWTREMAATIWSFSKWVMVSSIPTFFFREGDRIILGMLLSPTALGAYAIGTLLLSAVQQIADRLAGMVGLPVLAEKSRSSPQDLPNIYRRCRQPLDMFCLVAAGFLLAGGPAIVHLLYDQRYEAAGTTLRILALNLVAVRYTIFDQYLLATGESKQLFKRSLARVITLYICVPLGYWWLGTHGAIAGVVLGNMASVPVVLRLMAQRGLLNWRYELSVLPLVAVGALAGLLLP